MECILPKVEFPVEPEPEKPVFDPQNTSDHFERLRFIIESQQDNGVLILPPNNSLRDIWTIRVGTNAFYGEDLEEAVDSVTDYLFPPDPDEQFDWGV